MNLVLFTHPAYLGLQSQTRLVRMMADAFIARGHQVEVRQPRPRLRVLAPKGRMAKWAGYIDQYILFPLDLKPRLATDPAETVYVFCDQALGPWIPLVVHRPHVVHCLDLLALRSALGLIPENPVSLTGRVYQRYIRAGYRRARHFISISEKSRADLHEFANVQPHSSVVIYLGLNHPYQAIAPDEAQRRLRNKGYDLPTAGFLLHVGGGQWYKNTPGVLALYAAYVSQCVACSAPVLSLWLVSPSPEPKLDQLVRAIAAPGEVRFLRGIDNDALEALYSLSGALLFPSLAEGFGWPIVEAMACGCPVLTTGEAPMNEVGGPHAHYMPRLTGPSALEGWARHGAALLCSVLDRPEAERQFAAEAGIEWTRRFHADKAIDSYLAFYEEVLQFEQFNQPSQTIA